MQNLKEHFIFPEFADANKLLGENEEAIPPKIYTQEEVEELDYFAYQEGFSNGWEKGLAQGELQAITEKEKREEELIFEMFESLKENIKADANHRQQIKERTVRLSLAIIKKLFSTLSYEEKIKELEEKIFTVIIQIIGEKQITIKLSESHKEDKGLINRLHELCTDLDSVLVFEYTPQLDTFSFELKWDNGGGTWSQEDIFKQIEEAIDQYKSAN